MELFLLVSASFFSGIKLTALYERIFRGIKVSLNDYHFHHSLYGVALIGIAATLHLNQAAAVLTLGMAAFGAGSILQHTRSEHFVFIERENRRSNLLEGWEKTSEASFGKDLRITFYRNHRLRAAGTGTACGEKTP